MNQGETLNTYLLLAQCVEICVRHGVQYAVLSPGSRSAPVALSFLRNKRIQCFVIPDERSAAYTALGIAKQTQSPVALVCTSGTAALNYGPAVAEAYFSEVPLLVFTADRPAEWIGQADNQSIYQDKLYGKHAKASFTFPVDLTHPDARWHELRQLNEAINLCKSAPMGPVQLNIPLREPLYLDQVPRWQLSELPLITDQRAEQRLPDAILTELRQYNKILVAAGMFPADAVLNRALTQLVMQGKIVLLPDIVSNLQHVPGCIPFAELVLDTTDEPLRNALEPDLLMTFGGPVLSKTVKHFFREANIQAHWHIGESPVAADTYQRLSRVLEMNPLAFFVQWARAIESEEALQYTNQWQLRQALVASQAEHEMHELPYSEIKAIYHILRHLPDNSILHLGNSLPVRYVSAFPFLASGIEVYANRGTSGIDGSLSTAAGQSMADTRLHTLLLGDLSFMYDSNGLWNNYLKGNFKIIVINNHGGGIFRALPGPAAQPELEQYFVVPQPLHFEHMALQHNCRYLYAQDMKGLTQKLRELYATEDAPAILELDFQEQLLMSPIKQKIRQALG